MCVYTICLCYYTHVTDKTTPMDVLEIIKIYGYYYVGCDIPTSVRYLHSKTTVVATFPINRQSPLFPGVWNLQRPDQ